MINLKFLERFGRSNNFNKGSGNNLRMFWLTDIGGGKRQDICRNTTNRLLLYNCHNNHDLLFFPVACILSLVFWLFWKDPQRSEEQPIFGFAERKIIETITKKKISKLLVYAVIKLQKQVKKKKLNSFVHSF